MRTTRYGPLQNTFVASAVSPTSANLAGNISETFDPIVSATFSSETFFAATAPSFDAILSLKNPVPNLFCTLIKVNEQIISRNLRYDKKIRYMCNKIKTKITGNTNKSCATLCIIANITVLVCDSFLNSFSLIQY